MSDPDGQTVVHVLASSAQFDKISGGVTAKQLAGIKDNEGTTALWEALVVCPISQIKGGLQGVLQDGSLTINELNDALREVLDSEYFEELDKVRELISLEADKGVVLEALKNEVSSARTSGGMPGMAEEGTGAFDTVCDRIGV